MSEHKITAGAKPSKEEEQRERRASVRYPCNLQPSWRELGSNRGFSRIGKVHDISAAGIGLVVERLIKPGTVLVVHLQTIDQRLTRPLPMRVMHATAQPEGTWLVGCEFVRKLSNEDLQSLLRRS